MVETWGDIDGVEFSFDNFPSCFDNMTLKPKEQGHIIIAKKPYIDCIYLKSRNSRVTDILIWLDPQRNEEWKYPFAFADKSENMYDEYCHDAIQWYYEKYIKE